MPRYVARTGLIGAATIIGGLMIGSAPASAFTSSPLWTCRGSALSASVSGMNRVEPVVANGNPDTGNGGNPNYAQCVNSDVGENNLATPVGLPANFLSAPTADASTTITPEISPSLKQTFVAKGGVENLALNLGGPTTILGVGAANASVTGTCSANGTPTLTGTSQAVNLTLGGSTLSLDPLLTAVSQLLAPLHEIISIKVNEQIRTATGLTVNALHITILNSTTNAPVVDLIVGQAVGGYDSADICNPNKQYTIPPGIGGTGGNTGGANGSGNSTVPLTNQAFNGNIGSSNGPPATCGHLTMYFATNHKKSLTNIYGRRQVTRGRIISCGSKPKSIVGARIDVIHIIHGTRHLIKTGLRSRPGGLLTLILPLNLTSRSIEYDYRGKLNSTHVTSKQTLSLTVKTKSGRKL
ncbi:MAG TPA: choice-of-anchor P family protein [Solirubrobacteraceae bacterium]